MQRFALIFLVHFSLLYCAFSQNVESSRIAFVSYYAFEDEKSGVKILSDAFILSYPHHHGQSTLFQLTKLREQKIKELENKDLTEVQKTEINKHLAELSEKFEAIRKQMLETYEKRKMLLVNPLLEKIHFQLKTISKQNNLLIFNLDKLIDDGSIIFVDEKIDITNPVVSALNEYFKTGQNTTIKIEVTEPKIALLNTELFSDANNGIKHLVNYQNEIKKLIKVELGDNPTKEEVETWKNKNRKIEGYDIYEKIGNSLQKFSLENRFNLILDSSRKIPAELEKFSSFEVTKEFISYYNQKNQ